MKSRAGDGLEGPKLKALCPHDRKPSQHIYMVTNQAAPPSLGVQSSSWGFVTYKWLNLICSPISQRLGGQADLT